MSFVGDAEAIAQRLAVTRAQPSKVLSLVSAVLLVLWIIVMVFFFYVVVVTVKRHIPRLLALQLMTCTQLPSQPRDTSPCPHRTHYGPVWIFSTAVLGVAASTKKHLQEISAD